MSYNQQNKFPPREKFAVEEPKLALTSEPFPDGGKRGTLKWAFVGQNPRLYVYTNVPNDKNRGTITAELDLPTFYAILEALNTIIGVKEEKSICIQCKNTIWRDGKPSDKPLLKATVIIGRDANGIYISVQDYDKSRPKMNFYFSPSYYHDLVSADGKPLPKAFVSEIYAKAYHNMLTQVMGSVFVNHHKFREPKNTDKGGNGNQGGYNKGGNGGGNNYNKGGNSSSSYGNQEDFDTDDFDDDIPF